MNVLKDGAMTDVLSVISGSAGGVSSATFPLQVSGSVVSLNSSALMATSHEANKVGTADLDHGAFDMQTQNPDNQECRWDRDPSID